LLPYRNTAHAHIPETPKQGQTLQTEGTGPQVPNEITFRETVVVLEKKEYVEAVLATASAKTSTSKIIDMSRLSPNRLHPGMPRPRCRDYKIADDFASKKAMHLHFR
jgi:hypothetical protein